jgi:tetratricopeptide (TPR) repeat protein
MVYKKSLGMGLDILLAAADPNREKDTRGLQQVKAMFARAAEEDAGENYLEAYYWYRRVLEYSQNYVDDAEIRHIFSQSLNNIAVIVCEYGDINKAREYLHRALEIQPDNETARENLSLLNL